MESLRWFRSLTVEFASSAEKIRGLVLTVRIGHAPLLVLRVGRADGHLDLEKLGVRPVENDIALRVRVLGLGHGAESLQALFEREGRWKELFEVGVLAQPSLAQHLPHRT